MVYNWLNFIQQTLFPPCCLLCNRPGEADRDLCARCAADLPYPGNCCPRCAQPLVGDTATLCGQCQRRPPAFDRSLALFTYAEPVDRLLQELKYHRKLAHARLLGELLAERAAQQPRPDCLVPVPLHPRRVRQRGYNQSREIGRTLSRRLGIEQDSGHSRRIRATPPQSELSAAQRRANLRRAFAVTGDWSGRHVALIDDVMTTGSTVDELARAFKARGAEEVSVWVCARAGSPG